MALRGTGTNNEPRGIANTSGVQQMETVGEIDYFAFSHAAQRVAEVNGSASAVIYAPRTAFELDRKTDSTGQPLRPPPCWENLRKHVTNQVPTTDGPGEDESEAYVGDFSNVLIGSRTNLALEVSRQAASGANSAFRQMQVRIRAYLRSDVQLARPQELVYLSGITPPA